MLWDRAVKRLTLQHQGEGRWELQLGSRLRSRSGETSGSEERYHPAGPWPTPEEGRGWAEVMESHSAVLVGAAVRPAAEVHDAKSEKADVGHAAPPGPHGPPGPPYPPCAEAQLDHAEVAVGRPLALAQLLHSAVLVGQPLTLLSEAHDKLEKSMSRKDKDLKKSLYLRARKTASS